ncbi:MAG: hypothetical protein N7Q72_01365, partial [Spiroplasma sp. Tabriz.8]|nr:hypothetical protein [Spiroplasma sp. Tabriz.8]
MSTKFGTISIFRFGYIYIYIYIYRVGQQYYSDKILKNDNLHYRGTHNALQFNHSNYFYIINHN